MYLFIELNRHHMDCKALVIIGILILQVGFSIEITNELAHNFRNPIPSRPVDTSEYHCGCQISQYPKFGLTTRYNVCQTNASNHGYSNGTTIENFGGFGSYDSEASIYPEIPFRILDPSKISSG
jgi:hypothetical protein